MRIMNHTSIMEIEPRDLIGFSEECHVNQISLLCTINLALIGSKAQFLKKSQNSTSMSRPFFELYNGREALGQRLHKSLLTFLKARMAFLCFFVKTASLGSSGSSSEIKKKKKEKDIEHSQFSKRDKYLHLRSSSDSKWAHIEAISLKKEV